MKRTLAALFATVAVASFAAAEKSHDFYAIVGGQLFTNDTAKKVTSDKGFSLGLGYTLPSNGKEYRAIHAEYGMVRGNGNKIDALSLLYIQGYPTKEGFLYGFGAGLADLHASDGTGAVAEEGWVPAGALWVGYVIDKSSFLTLAYIATGKVKDVAADGLRLSYNYRF